MNLTTKQLEVLNDEKLIQGLKNYCREHAINSVILPASRRENRNSPTMHVLKARSEGIHPETNKYPLEMDFRGLEELVAAQLAQPASWVNTVARIGDRPLIGSEAMR